MSVAGLCDAASTQGIVCHYPMQHTISTWVPKVQTPHILSPISTNTDKLIDRVRAGLGQDGTVCPGNHNHTGFISLEVFSWESKRNLETFFFRVMNSCMEF